MSIRKGNIIIIILYNIRGRGCKNKIYRYITI